MRVRGRQQQQHHHHHQSSTAKKVAKRQRKLWLFHELTNRATCSGYLILMHTITPSLPPPLSLSLPFSLSRGATKVARRLAHAFWIARQIYAPPLAALATERNGTEWAMGQRLRLALFCLFACKTMHVWKCVCKYVCLCVCVCCLAASLAFIKPLRAVFCMSLPLSLSLSVRVCVV